MSDAILFTGMAVAASGAVVILSPGLVTVRHKAVAAIGWLIFCWLPLLLIHQSVAVSDSDTLDPAPVTDFAAAGIFHLGFAVFVGVHNRAVRAPAPPSLHRSKGIGRSVVVAAMATLVWCAWLVAVDGEITGDTSQLIATVVMMGASGALAGLFVTVIRRQDAARGLLVGCAGGLAAATGASASVTLTAGAIVAAIAGGTAAVVTFRGRTRDRNITSLPLLPALGIGGLLGLCAPGLMDVHRGLLHTGQPESLLQQAAYIAVVAVIACAGGIVSAGLAKGKRNRSGC